MDSLYALNAGEYLVGLELQKKFRDCAWFPAGSYRSSDTLAGRSVRVYDTGALHPVFNGRDGKWQ
jgi:hypothetical protein